MSFLFWSLEKITRLEVFVLKLIIPFLVASLVYSEMFLKIREQERDVKK